jgi:hypothetical protein
MLDKRRLGKDWEGSYLYITEIPHRQLAGKTEEII